MNREAQSIVLLLIGGALLRITVFSDVYLRYVKPGLRWYLVAAGVVLVVAAAITLYRELFGQPADEHDHSHGGPRVAWLLLLPVLTIFLIGPPSLGSYAAEKQGAAAVGQPSSDLPPLPAGDPVKLSVLDYVTRALWEDGASLRGREARLTGFVTVGPDSTVYLTRIVLSCCAADGRPLKVALNGVQPATLERDAWITVVGTYDPARRTDPVSREAVPTITVRTLDRIDPPAEPYDS
ncbi:TIGR03943 family putative permease subunit [Cryptosporangium aurantiacum]|uniref:TIGR03943 family protein n=1 Tax=Cryptosporangium aurantiacum TaxID=134849 RepID=A0A1M7Q5N1_9ACTN|nr:TIGR03943 family protein [Cryptosporangium aurantiacum]SHN25611.1 TIGR03943 family protein [Cryptosporangium aurantiacum]